MPISLIWLVYISITSTYIYIYIICLACPLSTKLHQLSYVHTMCIYNHTGICSLFVFVYVQMSLSWYKTLLTFLIYIYLYIGLPHPTTGIRFYPNLLVPFDNPNNPNHHFSLTWYQPDGSNNRNSLFNPGFVSEKELRQICEGGLSENPNRSNKNSNNTSSDVSQEFCWAGP